MSKIFILSGDFGSGKSMTLASFLPPHKKKAVRIIVEPEMRIDTYKSPDDDDHPEKKQYAMTIMNEGRFKPEIFSKLMEVTRKETWKVKPDLVGIDDVTMIQKTMYQWWTTKENLLATAKLYGKDTDRCLTAATWKPKDPGTIAFMKSMFTEWMLDLKSQNIYLIVTAPFHNVWQDYGKPGYNPVDHLPYMRILGQSANVQDMWLQMADVIWILNRVDAKTKKLQERPHVSMDAFVPKAALPGVPEQFEWPKDGWTEIWKWFEARTFTADLSKIQKPEPTFSAEQIEEEIKRGKIRLVMELNGIATKEEIKAIMEEEDAPAYTLETHDEIKKYITTLMGQRQKSGANTPPPSTK